MEDNLNPQTPITPRPVTRRPMDDFNAPTTPRPMSIPISTPDEPTPSKSDSFSDLNSKISEDITTDKAQESSSETISTPLSPEPEVKETPNVVPTPVPITPAPEPSDATKELIPGLNPKPEADAFKDSPVSLTDTSEQKASVIDPTKIDDKSNAGVITSAQYKQPSKKGRGVAILVAVILAVALIAGAAYAYMQNSKDTTKPTTETNTAVTTPVKESTATEDIDTLNTQIDDSLKAVNDTTDYQQNDLTDTTLGL